MEVVEINSSSEEDDDDVYLNSVAKLKALKKQTSSSQTTTEKDEVNKEEKKEEKIEVTNIEISEIFVVAQRATRNIRSKGNRSRPRTRRQANRNIAQELDSDLEIVSIEEMPNLITTEAETSLEITEKKADSSEDENYDIDIKVLWQSKHIHRLNIRQFSFTILKIVLVALFQNENFRKVFEYFSNLEQVPIDKILITKKDRIIKKNDTPASINLSVIDILDGGIIKKDDTVSKNNVEEQDDENVCVIKIQSTSKKSLTISVKRDEDFKALFAKCAQELNTEESKIKLYFDGDLVTITDTPESLEIEDEACFDIRISS
ncbi:DNA repair protein Rad60 isoform X1 [Calliopsis andreniformis]|uniref:DNA repair protein Rad60 isoform X1 n=1 Tax=Calliopsis andreniformis TaxID=337506 RepID=UPI003FCE09BA